MSTDRAAIHGYVSDVAKDDGWLRMSMLAGVPMTSILEALGQRWAAMSDESLAGEERSLINYQELLREARTVHFTRSQRSR
jgi:hypothetical protein